MAEGSQVLKNRFNVDKIRLAVVPIRPRRSNFSGWESWTGTTSVSEWHDTLSPENDKNVRDGYMIKSFSITNALASLGFRINSFRPPLNDQRVREGIQYALNWDAILDRYSTETTSGCRAPLMATACHHPNVSAREFDPRKARTRFAEAGFSKRVHRRAHE